MSRRSLKYDMSRIEPNVLYEMVKKLEDEPRARLVSQLKLRLARQIKLRILSRLKDKNSPAFTLLNQRKKVKKVKKAKIKRKFKKKKKPWYFIKHEDAQKYLAEFHNET